MSVAAARLLAVRIDYLLGLYHGQEWPPAPMRLLQALVAVNRGPEHPALCWLESRPTPDIIAELEPPQAPSLKVWVDENSPVAGWPRPKTERPVRQRIVRQPLIYLWTLREDEQPLAESLIQLLGGLTTLGTGHDSVVALGSLLDKAPLAPGQARFVPWDSASSLRPGGARKLRVPVPGALADIENIYQAWRTWHESGLPGRPYPKSRWQIYAPDHPGRNQVCLALHLRSGDGGPAAYLPTRTVILAGMTRGALLARARQLYPDDSALHDFIALHRADSPDDVPAYLPLPTLGHRHADGLLRRLLLLAPVGERERLERVYSLIEEPLPLIDEASGEIVAQWIRADDADRVVGAYCATGSEWHSVTPMVLPGDHAPDARTVLKLVRKALREVRLDDRVAHIEADRMPYHPQARPALAYRRRCKHGQRAYTWHVRIRFSVPVTGPIVIGRQRHHGLGLLACANPQ